MVSLGAFVTQLHFPFHLFGCFGTLAVVVLGILARGTYRLRVSMAIILCQAQPYHEASGGFGMRVRQGTTVIKLFRHGLVASLLSTYAQRASNLLEP